MQEKPNVILDKSFAFSVRIVKLVKYLRKEKKEYDLSGQIIGSGTSIGANAEEGVGGYSFSDFSAKISVAYKEARETRYWLRLLHATDYINKKMFDSLLRDCEELIKITSAILQSTEKKLQRRKK